MIDDRNISLSNDTLHHIFCIHEMLHSLQLRC